MVRKDAAAERWGEPALRNLDRWMISKGTSEADMARVVEGVWIYYSYYLFPEVKQRIKVGITGQQVGGQIAIHLLPFFPNIEASTAIPSEDGLQEALQDRIGKGIAPWGKIDMDVIKGEQRTPKSFTQEYAKTRGYHYIGVYRDSLRAELRTVIPEAVDMNAWLKTYNSALGGRPERLLAEAKNGGDRVLRDTILNVRHGSFA